MPKLTKLFEPISVGRMSLKNRIVFLAMGHRMWGEYGRRTAAAAAFLAARAKGGAALVMLLGGAMVWIARRRLAGSGT